MTEPAEKSPLAGPVRHIKPLGPRVLVRIVKLETRTRAGLILPEGVREETDQALYGEVVEVARAEDMPDAEPTLGTNVSGVPLGAYVLFPKDAGLPVPWDEQLRLLEVKHIHATVDEIDPAALQ